MIATDAAEKYRQLNCKYVNAKGWLTLMYWTGMSDTEEFASLYADAKEYATQMLEMERSVGQFTDQYGGYKRKPINITRKVM